MRSALQKLAQVRVSEEATVKLVGSWATGLAVFDSALDLVVEVPVSLDIHESLSVLASALADFDIAVTSTVAPGGPAISFDAATLTSSDSSRSHTGPSSFPVYVYVSPFGSPLRAASQYTTSRISRYPGCKETLVVIRQVLRKLGTDPTGRHVTAGISSYMVDLLVLTYLESIRDTPSYRDQGLVLREFFRFYSNFDFAKRSIASSPLFPEKVHPEDPLSVVDPVGTEGTNLTPGPTKLPQLHATVSYMSMLIQRYDWDRRGSPLLPNLIPAKALWKREEWLRQREGVEMTKELAVAVAQGVAEWLEDPANAAAKAEMLQQATWDTVQEMVRDQRLLRQVVQKPGSKLQSYRERLPKLVRAIDSFQSEPEMRELWRRTGVASTGPPAEPAPAASSAALLRHAAAATAEPERVSAAKHALKAEPPRPSDIAGRTQSDIAGRRRPVAQEFFAALCPEYDAESLPGLIAGLGGVKSEEERESLIKLMEATIDCDVAVLVLEGVVRFMADPTNAARREQLMRQAASPEGYTRSHRSAEAAVFAAVSEDAWSPLGPFATDYLMVVEFLDRFRSDPRMAEQIAKAAMHGVTRDVAFAIAKEVADFLEDPANQERKTDLMKAVLHDGDAEGANVLDTWVRVFSAVAETSKRLKPFRNNISQLVDLLARFRGVPEIDAERRRAARAVVTKDVAIEIARDVAEFLEKEDEQPAEEGSSKFGASVWENIESRVSERVLGKIARRMGLTAGSKESPVPGELMKGMLAFQEDPELIALRRRAVLAGISASHDGELSALAEHAESSSQTRSSSPVTGQHTSPPSSPSIDPPAAPGAGLGKPVYSWCPQPVDSAASCLRPMQFSFPASFEDDGTQDSANAPLDNAVRLLVAPGGFWQTHWNAQNASNLNIDQWQPPEGQWRGAETGWGGYRRAMFMADTPLGNQVSTIEDHRYMQMAEEGGGRCLLYQLAVSLPALESWNMLRVETLFRITEVSETQLALSVSCTVQNAEQAGMVAVMAQCAAETSAVMLIKQMASDLTSGCGAADVQDPSGVPSSSILNPTAKEWVPPGSIPPPSVGPPRFSAFPPMPAQQQTYQQELLPPQLQQPQPQQPQPQQPPDWVCPSCGATNPQRHRHFCGECRAPRPAYLPPPATYTVGGPPGGRFIRPPPGAGGGSGRGRA